MNLHQSSSHSSSFFMYEPFNLACRDVQVTNIANGYIYIHRDKGTTQRLRTFWDMVYLGVSERRETIKKESIHKHPDNNKKRKDSIRNSSP